LIDMPSSTSARYGHIKRKLQQGQPLKGELLQMALDAMGASRSSTDAELNALALVLQDGKPLDDYQLHLMVDMYLLHARLAEGASMASVADR